MTPDQLEIAKALERVDFRPGSDEKKFAKAIIATAKTSPGTELSDGQDRSLRDITFKYRRQLPVGLVIKQVQHATKTIHWIAPDLVKSGVIPNDPYVAHNASRAVDLFPQKSMQQCAAILASLHPYAFDYIAQAPVLVLAAAQGSALSKVAERKRVSQEWKPRFERGGKLRGLMESVGVPYALRKLHPSIMESNQWDIINALCEWDATAAKSARQVSVLADLIPDREDQKDWLARIGQWTAQMGRRFNNRGLHFEWACRQFNPANMRRTNQDVRDVLNHIAAIADFAGTHANEFNNRWTLDRALQEARRWHDEMARASHEQRFFLEHHLGWDEPVDYLPFPTRVGMGCYEFIALRSGKELYEEGRDMHHCVGSYSKDVIADRSRIYSMIDRDILKRVATVEFSRASQMAYPLPMLGADGPTAMTTRSWDIGEGRNVQRYRSAWHTVQAKGPYNGTLSKDAHAAIKAFEDRLNYYWAMFEHEQKHKEEYKTRLALAILKPAYSIIITPDEFPDLNLRLQA